MLVGVYAPLSNAYRGFSEVALDGTSSDLMELSSLLEKNATVLEVPLRSEGTDPSPYDGVLTSIRAEIVENT